MEKYKYIKAFPDIDIRGALNTHLKLDPILGSDQFYHFSSGRAALYHALFCLNLKPGSEILLPSFHCGVEVEAIIKAGYRVKFYGIKYDLNIDFNDLQEKYGKQVKIIVVIHYFGFPQDLNRIASFCDDNDVVLIEDCAHSLYSKYQHSWTGTFGSIGIYSLQKTIPLPNGGGLLINRCDIRHPPNPKKFSDLSLIKSTLRSILEFESINGTSLRKISDVVLKIYHFCLQGENAEVVSVSTEDMRWYYNVPRYDYMHDIWFFSKLLLSADNFFRIIKKRRENFVELSKILESSTKVQPIYNSLEEGVCPLCFPVKVNSNDQFIKDVAQKKLIPFIFGRFPHPQMNQKDYPESCVLSETLVGLPIHQQLNKRDMQSIKDIIG